MYIYPDNLTSKAMLWLWELRDVGVIGVGLLLSVLALTQTGIFIPLVLTAVYAFLSIRFDGTSILDFIRYAVAYGTNGMPDLGANQMYYSASVSGTIDTMPDIPGLAVWHDGHIGVYIGNGEVIEAMGTKYGVVKTELAGRGWTHWLQIEYINYD